MTNVKNESRLFKETKTIVQNHIADNIFIAGLWEEGLKVDEVLDTNRTVYRVQLKSRNLPKNIFIQLFKYMEFTFHLLLKYRKKRITMVNIHSLALLPIGFLFKLFYGTKLIYDAHEYETQRQGLSGVRKKLSQILERYFIKYCDRVIVVSESIADEYKRLYPYIKKPSVILNTPLYQEVAKKDRFREEFDISEDKMIFLYQGALSQGRGIENILKAFKQIDDDKSVVVFMGYGELEKEIKKYAEKFDNIYYHPAVSPDILLEFTSSADVGLSIIEDTCLSYHYSLPNKMFEYLMVDIPVIVSNLPEMRKIVNKYKIGVVASENSSKGLIEAIKNIRLLDKYRLLEDIKRAKEIYNWQNQEKVLVDLYGDLR
jgi:glycosyltransferase involved in cell wall biosynthesis